MKTTLKNLGVVSFMVLFFSAGAVLAAEDFKGTPPADEWTFGGMTGLGVMDSSAGVALLGFGSKKIVNHGFAPEINNQVFAESQLGPVFFSRGTAFFYSFHLRWDFIRDELLTPYAIGGVAGYIAGESLGDKWELFPRFGVGLVWNGWQLFTLRAEISHEMIVGGVSFPIQ